jgi:regulator of protease activity HflC (stomatin/prohibitin superfamily)
MKAAVGIVLLGLGLLILSIFIFVSVPAGHVGIVDLFGRVNDTTLAPGLHVINPLARVHRMSIQTREIKEVMDTPSSEGLTIHLEISTIFHLNPANAIEVYKTVGLRYDEILVHPNIRSAVREITSSYEVKALYSPEREKMGREINQLVRTTVEPRGVAVETVLLRDVKLPDRLQTSIQAKLSAEQEAAQMQFVLQKEQREAERKKIEAEGIATFQKIVSEGISENLLKWKGIETTKDLANSPNSKVIVIGSGKDGLPIILGSDTMSSPPRR